VLLMCEERGQKRMSDPSEAEAARVQRLKAEGRRLGAARRKRQRDKERLSQRIFERLFALPEYRRAGSVMFYVDVGDEVRTKWGISQALRNEKRVVVPYCCGERLELFRLLSLHELAAGTFGVPEPVAELRSLPSRRVEPEQLDLIIVPGVAFDRRGARLGRGKGYYDRFLAIVPAGTPLIAPAFECQIMPEIPTLPHDVLMDKVVTERRVYVGSKRGGLQGTPPTIE